MYFCVFLCPSLLKTARCLLIYSIAIRNSSASLEKNAIRNFINFPKHSRTEQNCFADILYVLEIEKLKCTQNSMEVINLFWGRTRSVFFCFSGFLLLAQKHARAHTISLSRLMRNGRTLIRKFCCVFANSFAVKQPVRFSVDSVHRFSRLCIDSQTFGIERCYPKKMT